MSTHCSASYLATTAGDLKNGEQRRKEMAIFSRLGVIRIKNAALRGGMLTDLNERATFEGDFEAYDHIDPSHNGRQQLYFMVLAKDKESNRLGGSIFSRSRSDRHVSGMYHTLPEPHAQKGQKETGTFLKGQKGTGTITNEIKREISRLEE